MSRTATAGRGGSRARDRRCCAGRVFEAAQGAAYAKSPDHDHYLSLRARLGANRASLEIARKLLRRAYHTLRELGDEALAPA
jgi:transposase